MQNNVMTKAIEQLEEMRIPYQLHEYPTVNGPVAAADVAAYLGFPAGQLVKTLVTTDHHGGYYVFCLPAAVRIDMKLAARAVGVKNLTMLAPEKFEELTGYVHGGCSPFGLKTQLPIFVEESVFGWDAIYLSGGRIGLTVEVAPQVLVDALLAHPAQFSK